MTDEKLVKKCLLTPEEKDKLWRGYKKLDPNKAIPWSAVVAKAQLLKAIPLIREELEERHAKDKADFGLSAHEAAWLQAEYETRKAERERNIKTIKRQILYGGNERSALINQGIIIAWKALKGEG